ncbi:hypothetical protein E2562_019073 [Oryza meyeriana var. granulata]|uniref:Uncharacterized protein n=1 Tax=Oryza meyeriana var. granulata TaxID=110450 RepID=A0A6G1CS83_9ORYZ|nr:hypothetical protein E2562_019073 [Oryza meyeriana var. granulata]
MDDLVDIVKAGGRSLNHQGLSLESWSTKPVDPGEPGYDVVVTGRLSAKWSPDIKDVRSNLDPMLIANFVRRTNELKSDLDIPVEIINKFEEFWTASRIAPLKGRNSILKGICPQIFGLFTVKLAVALTLIGGVQHVDASGTKILSGLLTTA